MRQLLFALIASSIGTSTSAQMGARKPNVYAPSACADLALPRRADSLDKLVLARMHDERIPAVELSVLRRGRIETRVYGYADLDHCVPADSNTIFGIGSVSKQLTAYATLRLAQAGSIALDDSITKYLPEARPMWDGITIRHLLTHTSGIRDYGGDDPVYPQNRIERRIDYSADSLIRMFARAPLNFPAGTQFAYSNTGYYMLSIALERAAHMPFADVMRTLVYEPLGMRSAGWWNPRIILPNLAVGYGTYDDTLTHGSYRAPTAGRWGGDTGLIATAADLARFQAELMHPRFVSADMVREMTAEGVDATIRLRGDTKELYFSDPNGIRIQVQDTRYRGGVGPLGAPDP
jgi:CubicO group peptidase (beta-lactamase class C family)